MGRTTPPSETLRSLPALVSSCVCFAIVAALVLLIKAKTGGLFVYPLDDSYIHLSLARTLTEHGVWGMNPSAFASASSSPGWTVLLATASYFFGTHLLTPIVFNLGFAVGVLVVADRMIRREAEDVSIAFRVLAGCTIVLATPLPSLVLLGMEHVAQTYLILLMIWYGARIACANADQTVPVREQAVLCLTALGAGAIRYESAFAVVLVGIALLWRRRFAIAALFALCSATGPFAFGLFFHRHSGFWLPFSVLSKSVLSRPTLANSLNSLTGRAGVPIVAFCLLVWVIRRHSHKFWSVTQVSLLLTVGVGTLHSLFAPLGWLMRYESYFVCIGLVLLFVALAQSRIRLAVTARKEQHYPLPRGATQWVAALLFLVMLVKFAHRIELGFVLPVEAAMDRYDEHVQVARFVQTNYDHDTIVVNDIGAVQFYTHAKLLDVLGLGSEQSLKDLYYNKVFLAPHLSRWADEEHASIAIIQIDYADNRRAIPDSWPLVRVWHVSRNVIFRDHSIGFFAVHPADTQRLCSALDRVHLPKEDSVTYDACPLFVNASPGVPASVPRGMAGQLAQPPY